MLGLGTWVYNLALSDSKRFFPEGGIEVLALSKKVTESMVLDQIYSDVYLCVIAAGFIWAYVCVHLRSLFLGTIAMINIGMSVPMAIVFYKMVCQVPFLCLLHILAILIVLGIGADNTFLFNDTWATAK